MIAITGGLGFIGSNLAHRLAREGSELLLVDHPLTARKLPNWVGLDRFRFLTHERFLEALQGELRSLEGIFHLGACSATTQTDWAYLQLNNISYTRALWDWCGLHDCPLIYASSAATYGDGSLGFDDDTPALQLQPLNLYGRSKNDFDIFALAEQSEGRTTPRKWHGMKFFNVYGPRENHKGRMASVVWQAWTQIRATGGMRLFRSTEPGMVDGGQVRDFVFVEDCIDHMLWLWQSGAGNGIYNSGTATPRSFYELAVAVFTALDLEPDIGFIDMPPDLIGKYQSYTKAEMDKLWDAGYANLPTSLEEGVRRTVEWLEADTKG